MRKLSYIIAMASSGAGRRTEESYLFLLKFGVGLFLLAGWLSTARAVGPVITTQPTNQTVIVGTNVTMSVTASGTLLGYQWYQNGSPILLAVGSSYTILGVLTSAAGNYTVVVSGVGGSVTSSVAVLTVNKAPAPMIISNLSQVYNGTARSVSVNTTPLGLVCSLTYNGSSSAPTNAGSYNVIATVIDLNYIGSVTNTLVVGQSATTNTLATSLNPAAANANVTFTATLAAVFPGGGTPAGNVTFKDGTTALGTGTLNGSGTATFTTASLAHGLHTIAAEYAGNSNYTGSTNSLSQLIDSPPIAAAQSWPRTPNASLKIRSATLLAGDSDPDNDTISLVSIATNSTAGGAVAVSGSWIFYTPPFGYTNTDSFSYVIADSWGLQTTGSVSVAVFISTNATPNIGSQSTLTNGAALIQFNDLPGRIYTVQCASNLLAPSWQALGAATADTTGKFYFTDSAATNSVTRYYRSLN